MRNLGQISKSIDFGRIVRSSNKLNRSIFITEKINHEMVKTMVPQLLSFQAADAAAPIKLYINSPGGSVTAGLVICDYIQYISPPVITVCIGEAVSVAAVLLAAGVQHGRFAYPNSSISLYQSSGDLSGKLTHLGIHARELLLRRQDILDGLISKYTGRSLKEVKEAGGKNDLMWPEEAKDFGLIDEII